MNDFGENRLVRQILEVVEADLRSATAEAPVESPIERLFVMAIYGLVTYSDARFEDLLIATDWEHFERLKTGPNGSCRILLPQAQLPGWRVDFLIGFETWSPERNSFWVDAIVECNGHDFHERTKGQAARDRRRDRQAVASGLPIFRFTGSELWRDPIGCARELLVWTESRF